MRACRDHSRVSIHFPHTRSIATMAADTTACWRYSALRIAFIGPPASGKGWGERAISTNRCNSTLLPHVPGIVPYGMGKRSGDDGWWYLQQSPSTACLAGPLVTSQRNFRHSRNSLAGPARPSSSFLPYYRSKCMGTTAQMGQATPASRCEPTFRSSEMPTGTLLAPKQHPRGVSGDSGRLRSGSGTRFKMSIKPNDWSQSPLVICDL